MLQPYLSFILKLNFNIVIAALRDYDYIHEYTF